MRGKKFGRPSTLSFEVVEVVNRYAPESTVPICDTKLRLYTSGETLTIRGNPWPVGMKVDFIETRFPRHICHALRCETPVPPKLLMCRKHWFMVPKALRDEVWRTYRPGQEIDKSPSSEYLSVMNAAIDAVADREGVSRHRLAPAKEEKA